MKCSSQRNCNENGSLEITAKCGLNEVQFPKELQPAGNLDGNRRVAASMKCSSQRNCNLQPPPACRRHPRLNEVQFPKELQPPRSDSAHSVMRPQ